MPGFDGTGPLGQGSMTGRRMGNCSGAVVQGAIPRFGCGFGRGRGFAFRARDMQPAKMTEKEEKQYLEEELETLKQEIKEVEKRLKELKA